jgi:hypothetical protein
MILLSCSFSVIPAQAGIQRTGHNIGLSRKHSWIPAYAGMTTFIEALRYA